MTNITTGTHHHMACYLLENQYLQVKVCATFGAKILSLYHKQQDLECLFQPTKKTYEIPRWGDDFSKYDTSGLDDCIPTIDPCQYPLDSYPFAHSAQTASGRHEEDPSAHSAQKTLPLPDHGDVWAMPWEIQMRDETLICRVQLKSLPLLFTRKMTLQEETLVLDYEVQNQSSQPVAYLWALHGLNIYDEQAEIFFEPALQTPLFILGEEGSDRFDWHRLGEYPDQKAYKFYFAETAQEGRCGIIYKKQDLLYTIHFDPKKQPYVGMWLTKGGFKGEYNIALEPSNGFYDDVSRAIKKKKVPWIAGKQIHRWQIRIEFKRRK